MIEILLKDIADSCNIKSPEYIIIRNDAVKIKEKIMLNYNLIGNIFILNFKGIISITGSVIDEIILKEYEEKPQRKSSDFLGAYILSNLSSEVYDSIQTELLARMKKSNKSYEFIIYLKDNNNWDLLPYDEKKSYLEPKIKEVLDLIMKKKELTSPELVMVLKNKEKISTKNARIRLEKLYNQRLVYKIKGEGKEFVYKSLI